MCGITVVLNENGEFYFSGDSPINGKICSFTKFYCNPNIVNVECGYDHIVMLDSFGKLFYSDRYTNEIVNLEMPFKIKQIGSSCNSITLLNENNELYFRREYSFDFYTDDVVEKREFTKIEINNNIIKQASKILSGLSDNVYFQSTTTMDSLYYFYEDDENKEIKELYIPLKENEKFVLFFLFFF